MMEELDTQVSLVYPVVAYAVSDELSLDKLRQGLIAQGLYIPTEWHDGDGKSVNLTIQNN